MKMTPTNILWSIIWQQTCKYGNLSNRSALEFMRPRLLFWTNKGISQKGVHLTVAGYPAPTQTRHYLFHALNKYHSEINQSASTSGNGIFFYYLKPHLDLQQHPWLAKNKNA